MLRKLLTHLSDGQFHSGEALGEALGVSRAAVWKQLKKLDELDIPYSSVKGKGYRLHDPIEYSISLPSCLPFLSGWIAWNSCWTSIQLIPICLNALLTIWGSVTRCLPKSRAVGVVGVGGNGYHPLAATFIFLCWCLFLGGCRRWKV